MPQRFPTVPPNGYCSNHLEEEKDSSCENCKTRMKELKDLFRARSTRSNSIPLISPKSLPPDPPMVEVEEIINFSATAEVSSGSTPAVMVTTDTQRDCCSRPQPSPQAISEAGEQSSYTDVLGLNVCQAAWPYNDATQETMIIDPSLLIHSDYSFSLPAKNPEFSAENLALSPIPASQPLVSEASMAAETRPAAELAKRPVIRDPIAARLRDCQRNPLPLPPVNEHDPVYSDLYALERGEVASRNGKETRQAIEHLLQARRRADKSQAQFERDFEAAEQLQAIRQRIAEGKSRTGERRQVAAESQRVRERLQTRLERGHDTAPVRGRGEIPRSAPRQDLAPPAFAPQPTQTLPVMPTALQLSTLIATEVARQVEAQGYTTPPGRIRKRKASLFIEEPPASRLRRTLPPHSVAAEIRVTRSRKRKLSSPAPEPPRKRPAKRQRKVATNKVEVEGQLAPHNQPRVARRRLNYAEDEMQNED